MPELWFMDCMTLHRNTWGMVSVGAVMFGFNGLVAILKLPHRTLEHWIVTFGGMILIGLLFGFAVALLVTGFHSLLPRFSLKAGRNKWIVRQ